MPSAPELAEASEACEEGSGEADPWEGSPLGCEDFPPASRSLRRRSKSSNSVPIAVSSSRLRLAVALFLGDGIEG